MIKKFYTILYKYDGNQADWHDIEKDYDEEEVERELRRMRKDYPSMTFRKKSLGEREVQVCTARRPGSYIPVAITLKENWAGERYFLFHTKENGRVAEVDICKGFFRIFGYKTDIWDLRKTRQAAMNCAKKQVREFFNAIGDTRPIVFC